MVQTVQSRLTFLAADPSAAEGGWPRPERPALRLKTRVGGSRCGGGGQSPRRRRKALGTATGCQGRGCKSASGQQYGVQTDPNGLLYMKARYYNPYICRFLNPDPSGFAGGLNLYAAFNGNPISNVDPTGLGAVGDNSAAASWINNASGVPANLSDPFGVNANNPSTGTLVGNGLNNTVSAIGQTIGQGLYDLTHLQFSTAQYNQIANTMYSTATPENPAATPYVEGALAVSGAADLGALGAGVWGAVGLPTMNVAVAPGQPYLIHVAYGVGDTWVNAVGTSLGNLTVSPYLASQTAASAYFTVTGIPVLNSAAVLATGGTAATCVTAAGSAFVRGWLP